MLQLIAAFLLLFWSLGLISGIAVSSAIHILPVVALVAIVLCVFESVRHRARERAPVPHQPVVQLHAPQAPASSAQHPAQEHAKAA